MRLITYSAGPAGAARIGVRVGHRVLDIEAASRVDGEPLPATMKALLREGRGALSRVQALAKKAQSNAGRFASALVEERAIRFLPPVPDPDRFLCVATNLRARSRPAGKSELLQETAREVTGFVKLAAGLVGHNARLARPEQVVRLGCEPELVFVIGRRVQGFKGDDAWSYVAGVTLLGDLTDRDLQERESAPGARARPPKGAPGFGPVGPEIVTMDEIPDPDELWITCAVNGEERVRVNVREQIGQLPAILEHFSRNAPIEPGDMFSTGASGGDSAANDCCLEQGDVVECSIEGITTLRVTIVAPGTATS